MEFHHVTKLLEKENDNMTTIVWDGKELVSDSQVTTMDTAQLAPFRKIHTPEEHEFWSINGIKVVAFALAGEASAIDYVKEKLQKDITYKTRFDDNNQIMFHAIVIDEKGQSFVWRVSKDKHQNRERTALLPMLPPIAMGSGTDFALGVLSIGRDARTAVKAAIKLDVGSGGALQIFEFPGVPEVLSVRPPEPEPEKKPEEPAPSGNGNEDAKKDIEHKRETEPDNVGAPA